MPFSLVKAIKSTHMNPINRILHCIGAPFYIFGIVMIVGHFLGTSDFNLLTGIILWSIAVGLFLTGHKIERNLRAMTLIILFRYILNKTRWVTKNLVLVNDYFLNPYSKRYCASRNRL